MKIKKVAVVSASIGAGHDGAAEELARGLASNGCAVTRHDFLDLLGPRAGRLLRRSYEAELRAAPDSWGWLLQRYERHPAFTGFTGDVFGRLSARRTRAALAGVDLVVSTYPLASQALGRLRRAGDLAVPVTTFLTYMSVHPLWVADGVDLHLALHPVAAGQARRWGAARVRVCRPAVRPACHAPVPARLPELPAGPVALVVAGSWGVGEVFEAATDIAATGLATPVTVCGRNEGLRDRLARAGVGVPLGWVDDMPGLIAASDVVVQNAGGLTSLEAMATGVPVLSYRCLPGHGTTNAAALAEAGLAVWVRDPVALAPALDGLLHGELRQAQRAAAAGVFAAADPVAEILSTVDTRALAEVAA